VHLYCASWGLFRFEKQKSSKQQRSRTVKKQTSKETEKQRSREVGKEEEQRSTKQNTKETGKQKSKTNAKKNGKNNSLPEKNSHPFSIVSGSIGLCGVGVS